MWVVTAANFIKHVKNLDAILDTRKKNVKNSSNAIKHTIRDDIHINWIQLHMRVKLQISNVATCFG